MVGETLAHSHPRILLARCVGAVMQPTATIVPLLVVFNGLWDPQIGLWRWLVWSCVTVTCAATIPSVLFLVLRRRGTIADLWVSDRAARPLAYAVMIPSYGLGIELARRTQAPRRTVLLMAAVALSLTVAAAVNQLLCKISIHTMSASLLAVALVMTFGLAFLPGILVVPAVWWARVSLRAHTIGEAAAGAIVGGGIGVLVFLWL